MIELVHKLPDSFFDSEYRQILVDGKMKEIWAVELDLLLEFDRICRKRDIKYSLAYGTLLGAVRHGGFIPWDNDIDVIMLRDEYQKLRACAEEFSAPYFLQNEDTDYLACRGHAQLRNAQTTGILRSEMKGGKAVYAYNQGIFLDIFVLDEVPLDSNERNRFFGEVARLKRKVLRLKRHIGAYQARSRIKMPLRKVFNGMLLALKDKILGRNSLKKLEQELEDLCCRYRGQPGALVSPIMFCPRIAEKECYPREIFEDFIEVEFEHLPFMAVRRYDEILTQKYGNWHKHIIGGDAHGGVLFDVHRAYSEYL